MDRIEVLKRITEKSNEDADSWYLLGMELSSNNRIDEAIKAFTQALKFSKPEMKDEIYSELDQLTSYRTSPSSNGDLNSSTHDTQHVTTEEYINNSIEPDEEMKHVIPLRLIKGGNHTDYSHSSNTEKKVIQFQDVGGLEALKESIRMKIIKPFANPGLFEKFRKKIGGGLLLFGPPGCGKTFIARATAGECRTRFIPVHITDILNPYIGMSEQNIRDIFTSARANKPCILFFDEIDTIGFNRSKMSTEHFRPIIDQLLSEIEGIDSNTDRMLIIGATNMPWDVDPAFKRPGRFDRTIFVPPPDLEARVAIFQLKIADRPCENIDILSLARNTELYSGADIESVVETASEIVILEIMKTGVERRITMKDMKEALTVVKPSTVEWLKTIKNYIKYANQSAIYDDVDKYLSTVKFNK